MTLRVTILGCGSSGGVPRIGNDWGDCDPGNPKNRRRRCSILVERTGPGGTTRVLIDTSPDMRDQLLEAQVPDLDAVVYTHMHADHLHGIDDLRALVLRRRARLPVWADPVTADALEERFAYVFVQPEGSHYPPILDLTRFTGPFDITGAGGGIGFVPLEVEHGRIKAFGFRIGDLCYLPDVSHIPEAVWDQISGLEMWIVDALRRTPHPSHSHLEQTLAWIDRAAPRRAVLTNLHVDMDYATLAGELPGHIVPAHDGLVVEIS